MAADIEDAGSGAAGRATVAALELESADLSFPAPLDGFAASSAPSKSADVIKMANAAVAINLALDLIVASPTARRDHQKISAAG
jgi:hypothetical protein